MIFCLLPRPAIRACSLHAFFVTRICFGIGVGYIDFDSVNIPLLKVLLNSNKISFKVGESLLLFDLSFSFIVFAKRKRLHINIVLLC